MITFKHVVRFFRSLFFQKKHLTTIADLSTHFLTALLCVINRGATMEEHHCNEHDLFLHPLRLFKHYFKYSGVCLSKREKILILKYARSHNGRQVVQACTCIVNLVMTMEEYKCDPQSFLVEKNHERLIKHYIYNGGAKEFAIKRKEFVLKHPVHVAYYNNHKKGAK